MAMCGLPCLSVAERRVRTAANMSAVSTIQVSDGDWFIEVTVRTLVRMRPRGTKREATKVVRVGGYKTQKDAERDEPFVYESVVRSGTIW